MSTRQKQIMSLFLSFLFLIVVIFPEKSLAASYYEGKVITLIVGEGAGSGYDLMARLLAKYMRKYIPGNPPIIVQNIPGASSIIAANQLYHVAKPDGLTIGLFTKTLPFSQLLKVEGIRFDVTKFLWIGSSSIDFTVLALRSDLPYKNFQDLLRATETLYIGGTGPRAMGTQLTVVLKKFSGLNAKIVEYRGTAEIWLAMERKEVDGQHIAYNSGRQYIDRGLARVMLRTQLPKSAISNLPAEIGNIPVHEDFFTDEIGKKIMGMFAAVNYAGKPFAAPPGTPVDAINILRDAFAKAIKDPELKADAQKSLIDVIYVTPEEVLEKMNYILNQPPDVVKQFREYVKF